MEAILEVKNAGVFNQLNKIALMDIIIALFVYNCHHIGYNTHKTCPKTDFCSVFGGEKNR